jgi:hypothetical protein
MATKPPSPAGRLPVPVQVIERRIYIIRGKKVMLDSDLAELYQVATKALNQAVNRNRNRFPEDSMFQLSAEELKNWRSQIVTSNPGAKMGLRRPPFAFTELGVAMLSSVLSSDRAVQMNIVIMRAFVRLREALATHKDLEEQIAELAATQHQHAIALVGVIKEIKRLKAPRRPKPRIGFYPGNK